MNVMHAEKTHRLYTPGPVNIPIRVATAASYVNYHHRTASFSAILTTTLEQMRPLFGTESALVIPVHATGRGAMEGAYANLLTADDRVICVSNGYFGKMSADILERLGLCCFRFCDDWTVDIELDLLEEAIISQRATAVVVVHNDTGNAIVNPISEIAAICRKHDLLCFVDAVSSIGCLPFEFDAWGVDVVTTSSQKGLMSPPGLAFVVLSDRAWQRAEQVSSGSKASYINLLAIRKSLTKGETPGTTPVSLILAVSEAVQMICEEGLEAVLSRHRALGTATKDALLQLRFNLFPQEVKHRSEALSVVEMLPELDGDLLVSHLADKYGLLISMGLGHFAKTTLRIANMGDSSLSDMLLLITALEAGLTDLGYPISMGRATAAFMQSYNRTISI